MNMTEGGAFNLERASRLNCNNLDSTDAVLRAFCEEYQKLYDRYEDLSTQLYIVAGVGGGIALILILLIIVLFVKLNNVFKDLTSGDELQKRGFSTYTGRQAEAHNPSFSPSPPPFVSSPAPYATGMNKPMPFDNAAAGGVRVLPRNPPPMMRNNNY